MRVRVCVLMLMHLWHSTLFKYFQHNQGSPIISLGKKKKRGQNVSLNKTFKMAHWSGELIWEQNKRDKNNTWKRLKLTM